MHLIINEIASSLQAPRNDICVHCCIGIMVLVYPIICHYGREQRRARGTRESEDVHILTVFIL